MTDPGALAATAHREVAAVVLRAPFRELGFCFTGPECTEALRRLL